MGSLHGALQQKHHACTCLKPCRCAENLRCAACQKCPPGLLPCMQTALSLVDLHPLTVNNPEQSIDNTVCTLLVHPACALPQVHMLPGHSPRSSSWRDVSCCKASQAPPLALRPWLRHKAVQPLPKVTQTAKPALALALLRMLLQQSQT
jgi:hypothetical protein